MKRISIATLILIGLTLIGARADEGAGNPTPGEKAKKLKLQTICPIMGGKINKSLYVDALGKRIYVCCPVCIAHVKKDPAAAIKKLEDQGVTVATLQTRCPVMDGKINKSLYADVNGKRIYVCCPGCIDKIKADPARYIKKLEAQGIALDDTPKP